jgi:hypothetical protein
MTSGNRERKVQVHALTRVGTYSGIISPCTCTNPLRAPSPAVITKPSGSWPTSRAIMSDPLRPMTGEPITHHSRDGRLSPWADKVTVTPGWQITTGSRRLALAVAAIVPVEPSAFTRKANGRQACPKRS